MQVHEQGIIEEWRRLTAEEGAAIRAMDWGKVEERQRAKERLMEGIDDALVPDEDLRRRISEVLVMEKENQRQIEAIRGRLEDERAGLDRTTRAVRQVSKAYGSRANAAWQSYS